MSGMECYRVAYMQSLPCYVIILHFLVLTKVFQVT